MFDTKKFPKECKCDILSWTGWIIVNPFDKIPNICDRYQDQCGKTSVCPCRHDKTCHKKRI